MDDFKWGEDVEASRGGDEWVSGFKYGCVHPSYGYIVFNELRGYGEEHWILVRRPRPDLKVDDRVWVKKTVTSGTKWLKRHFAGWDEETGRIKAFGNGTTSWSAEDTTNTEFAFEEYSLTDPEQEDK